MISRVDKQGVWEDKRCPIYCGVLISEIPDLRASIIHVHVRVCTLSACTSKLSPSPMGDCGLDTALQCVDIIIHVHSTLAKEYKGRKVIPTQTNKGTHTCTSHAR